MKNLIHSKKFVVFIFLLPASFFCIIYLVAPIPLSAYYSFLEWDGMGKGFFIGWQNWTKLIHDEIFWVSVANNFKLVFLSLIVQIPMAILLALFLSSKLRGTKIFKTIFFVPMLLSSVAVAFLWRYMYDPNFGLINNFLNLIGLNKWALSWLGNPDIAFYSVVAPVSWRFIPLYMIIFMAAISGIPEQLYEAAKIDGANSLQVFWRITLPLLRPTIISAAVLIIVGSLKYFAMIFALTGGGPNHASELMATYMYTKAFTELRMGYGSTISLALFIIAFVVSIVFLYITNLRKGVND
ncbi:ABC transporter permease subunit [Iocasia frigidifontis]|uniref:ABC transporter permease subunit n=1 Tax=Iocasia fonsfrigidae TaxID=2682810 RepID=A0A8A7KLT2_9FIRM|nr:sugar ABC transporter permease [Iocasia fonsfrigidae]QTL99044.1 ABC transporter permease subunit [Iocasia fonsfrigidae]